MMNQLMDIFRREDDSVSLFRILTFIAAMVFIYSALLEMHTNIKWEHFEIFGYIVIALVFGCGCNKVVEFKMLKVSDAPKPAENIPVTKAINTPGKKGESI